MDTGPGRAICTATYCCQLYTIGFCAPRRPQLEAHVNEEKVFATESIHPGRFMHDDRGVFLCNPIIAKHWSSSTALIDSSATEIEQLHR
jgi:hypothetical protein